MVWSPSEQTTFGAQLLMKTGPSQTQAEILYGLGAAGVELAAMKYLVKRPTLLTDELLRSYTGPNRGGILFDNPSQAVTSRIDELLVQIPANSRGRITMGVGVAEDAAGNRIMLASTSEPNGYLRPGVTLRPGEVLVPGPGGIHAEMDIVRYAQENNLNLVGVGATRPVCTGCQARIPDYVDIYTPLGVR